MGMVIKMLQGRYRVYFKGASEILAKRSNKYIVVCQDGNYSHGIKTKDIDEVSWENTSWTIIFYVHKMLHRS